MNESKSDSGDTSAVGSEIELPEISAGNHNVPVNYRNVLSQVLWPSRFSAAAAPSPQELLGKIKLCGCCWNGEGTKVWLVEDKVKSLKSFVLWRGMFLCL